MMSRWMILVFLLCLVKAPIGAQDGVFSHGLFDRVLGKHVDAFGRVDYSALKADFRELDAYLEQLKRYSPETTPDQFPSSDDRLAYWINAYNAFAIAGVVDAYPVKSVRDIKWFYGFFNRTKHTVGGKQYTLKHIEHEIVRKRFDDPRIHAALNCASAGCPRLPQKAFHAQSLQTDLDGEIRFFLREERNVLIEREQKRVHLSHLLKEFERDFTSWVVRETGVQKATIFDYLVRYIEPGDALFLQENPDLKVSYFKYDWTLNDQALNGPPQALQRD